MPAKKDDRPAKGTGLKAYREKRSADRTPEPFGGGVTARRFVIQKHAARRMHYDLRLEWGGVLHSWAVPKGLSTDPQAKHLAVMTEDHPLNYADFEGLIPQGNYGAGTMIVWDQGLWIPLMPPDEGLEKGKLHFELRGYKARGEWELIRPKAENGNQWLFFKKKDGWVGEPGSSHWTEESVLSGMTIEELRDGSRRGAHVREMLLELKAPQRERPLEVDEVKLMLAEAVSKPFSRPGWFFELKYDGFRILASRENGRAKLRYRNGLDATHVYPSVARTLAALPYQSYVLDAEVAVLDPEARPSFGLLQKRALLTRHTDIQRADVELPALLYVFDLLAFEEFDLRPLPYKHRKEVLRAMLPGAGPLKLAEHIEERGEEAYDGVRRLGLEGLLAKDGESAYTGGRSRSWLKIRLLRTADLAVVGYTPPKGSRTGFGALHLAYFDGRDFRYAGRVGTGFDHKQIGAIYEMLQPLVRPQPIIKHCPPSLLKHTWVEPRLVCEVRYTEWTEQGLLRQPVFVRLRDDKSPTECLREYQTAPKLGVETETPQEERKVVISRPKKIFWPEDGITKGDLIEYHRRVAPWLLPFLVDRPVVLTRYPDGIHGKWFFQKDAPPYVPDWLRRERMWSEHAEREIDYFICDHVESLLYLINMGTIPLHIWSSRTKSLSYPDWTIIDLDPKESPFKNVVTLAKAFRKLCNELGLPSYCKTSGSSGLHVIVPLGGRLTYQQSRTIAELLSRVVTMRHPEIATMARSLHKREGKVYLDTVQNGQGRLLVSPYCVRPLPGAPVSMPLAWSEVNNKLHPRRFTLRNAPQRLAEQKRNPWKKLLQDRPNLIEALGKLDGLVT